VRDGIDMFPFSWTSISLIIRVPIVLHSSASIALSQCGLSP
jgi:hypothetical protein